MSAIKEIFSQGLMITGFVMIMMMVIEYLNVLTRGSWDHVIEKRKAGQLVFCSFLGATPGCLGAYAVGSLFIHRVIGFGALVAAMVATCGDEAFVMLALFPRQALLIFAALFAGGIITGAAVDYFAKRLPKSSVPPVELYKSSHPGNPRCIPFSTRSFVMQWRNCSPQRGWLTFFLVIFLGGIISGAIGHEHGEHGEVRSEKVEVGSEACAYDHSGHNQVKWTEQAYRHPAADNVQHEIKPRQSSTINHQHSHAHGSWIRITFIVLSLIALGIVATVPDHFLNEHLWNHLIKVHGWKILLWTIGALTVTHVLVNVLDINEIVTNHKLPILLIACLIGIIPVSGPHLVFVTLYAAQALPLSVLVANSIVQDGHGMLPTLAHSRRSFIYIKILKLIIGLGVGVIGHLSGW